MSLSAFGKVPPYQDISHFRAPYKNAIFAGFGAGPMHQAVAPTHGPIKVLYYGRGTQTYVWSSASPQWIVLQPIHHMSVFDTLKSYADNLAHAAGQDVHVYRSSGPQGPVGGLVYTARAHGVVSLLQPRAHNPRGTHGFGDDPSACLPPKWTYSGFTDSCVCAPGYAATPDGTDCIPLTPNPVPPTGGLNTWTLTDPITGATTPVPAGTPGAVPAPAPAATACTGYQVGSTCVPSWALWVGGGLAALLVVDMVL